MSHMVFNFNETAEYLHISCADLQSLVKDDKIPFEQQGARIVFRQKEIDVWATRRILGLPKNELADYHRVSSVKAHDLSKRHALAPELFKEKHIETELMSRTMHSVIRDMVDLAEQTGLVVFPGDLLISVQKREKMAPTALPGGFALLHPSHPDLYMFEDSFIVLGRTVQPIPFSCTDGMLTDLFFLVCCQDDRIHLHTLARLCMMCQHTRLILELREAETSAEMFAVLVAAEEEVIGSRI